MLPACPHLPPAPAQMDWRELRRHGTGRGAEFYLSALTYGQHLWQRGLAARALLAVDRALLADVAADEPVLKQWPPPYRALRWIMENATAEALVGNPRVHYQHLAGRVKGPRASQRRARAWAAWHLACIANPQWPGDPKHTVREPTFEETTINLTRHGLPGEAKIWQASILCNPLIRTLEELSMNAWPARHTQRDDGWVLRIADGYTRRANSINPLYPSKQETQAKIRAYEQIYRDKGLRPTFKMTAASFPADLDDTLASCGYIAEAHSSVQWRELAQEVKSQPLEVKLTADLTDKWLAAYAWMSSLKAEQQAAHEDILRAIRTTKRFASITSGNQIIACGLGVLENGWIGFYDIVVAPDFRRHGHAKQLMVGLLAWGKSQGASRGYLQVMLNNQPGLALYAKLGFREEYRYWYRVKA